MRRLKGRLLWRFGGHLDFFHKLNAYTMPSRGLHKLVLEFSRVAKEA